MISKTATLGWVIPCILISILGTFAIVERKAHVKWEDQHIEYLEHLTKYTHETDLLSNEGKSAYLGMMEKFRIAYGPRYNARSARNQAMNNAEFSKWANLCWALEKELGLKPGTLIAIAITETGLRKYREGIFEEVGMFQVMPYNYKYIRFLWYVHHDDLPRWVNPQIKTKEDMWDIMNLTKAVALMIYDLRLEFRNDYRWVTTAYHFGGGYAYKHYDYGRGEIPKVATFYWTDKATGLPASREEEPDDYYQVWHYYQGCFEMGRVEAGDTLLRESIMRARRRLAQGKAREYAYARAESMMVKFERQIANAIERNEASTEELTELKERVEEAKPLVTQFTEYHEKASRSTDQVWIKRARKVYYKVLSILEGNKENTDE